MKIIKENRGYNYGDFKTVYCSRFPELQQAVEALLSQVQVSIKCGLLLRF